MAKASKVAANERRKAGLSRINFRSAAHRGELPGVTKSSW